MKSTSKYNTLWIISAGVGCFVFFFLAYPYHLLHKEQTLLFTYSAEQLTGYLEKPAILSCLGGDFCTQFLHYNGIGAITVALIMTAIALLAYSITRKWLKGWQSVAVALIIMIWETMRFCNIGYSLSGSFSLIGGMGTFLIINHLKERLSFVMGSMAGIALCYWLFGYGAFIFGLPALIMVLSYKKCYTGAFIMVLEMLAIPPILASHYLLTASQVYTYPSTCWWGKPDFQEERILGLNTEDYFENWEKINKLAQPDIRMGSISVSYNLANAMQGCLPERLMNYYQPAGLGLFIPIVEESTYLSTQLAGEVWFRLGDMTMAEHASILSMIFSPRHKGARMVQRMAEINLINGDTIATYKYLHLLSQTLAYKQWAQDRMPGKETPEVRKWLQQKRTLLPLKDTIRTSSVDIVKSLHLLLEANPQNQLALDYLLCYHLLMKDLFGFRQAYDTYYNGAPNRLYAEALLILLYKEHASGEEIEKTGMNPAVVKDFNEYNYLHKQYQGNPVSLKSKFEKTYWYYYMYAQFESVR